MLAESRATRTELPGHRSFVSVVYKPHFIRPNHLKKLVLLKIWRIKRDCSYLPTGTLRRSSSEKVSRKITLFCAF